MRRRHDLLGGCLEVEYVERVGGLFEPSDLQRIGEVWKQRKQRACRDEVQERTTFVHEKKWQPRWPLLGCAAM